MKKRKRLILGMVVFSVVLTSFSFYFYQLFFGANVLTEEDDRSRIILIDNDDNFDSVRNDLYEARIIQDALSFSFVSKTLGYQELVKPGVYELTPKMTNLEAVRKLRAGDQVSVELTFNNIRLKEELAGKITRTIGLDSVVVLNHLNDPEVHERYGFTNENIIGMFIPNTYDVYWTIGIDELFDRMKNEYDRFWNQERKEKAAAMGLSPQEVSTLSSIVQAESIKSDESEAIAGLYYNRLKKNMKLQADPTVKFALGDFAIQRILIKDTQVDSPYNTYMYAGLPPGPINLPTIQNIDAVLNYEQHDYIYMCAKEDFSGYHRFATTLSEHNRNARLFQQALNRRNIYR
jgi:UPF0755 protein